MDIGSEWWHGCHDRVSRPSNVAMQSFDQASVQSPRQRRCARSTHSNVIPSARPRASNVTPSAFEALERDR
eukprot:9489502-Pyramimonas_sp.AAC.1